MATVIVMLKRHYEKKDGSYPIVLQVNANRKQKYVYSGYSVSLDQWDDRKWVKRAHKDHKRINNELENKRRDILDRITELEKDGKPLDLKAITQAPDNKSFSQYLRSRLAYFAAKGNINMEYKINADIRELEAINGGEVYYNDITISLLKKLEVYYKRIGNHQNTIARKFKNYRTHYKAATLEDSAPVPNPFELVKIRKEPVSREKLTGDEIERIERLELSGSLLVARDMFMFSFYTQGMRFENVLTLRKDQIKNGTIFYQMNKGKKYRGIDIHPKLSEIVSRYINSPGRYLFPLLLDREYTTKDLYHKKGSENAQINLLLKTIANMADIQTHVTFHIARHSFAWKYYTAKKGEDIDVLKDAMGHSNMQVTQMYLKSLDDGYINQKVNEIF